MPRDDYTSMAQWFPTDAEILEQIRKMQQRGPLTSEEMLGMANYRPPVFVPEGWAEWFRHGTEIT